jgi:hypothetical protein
MSLRAKAQARLSTSSVINDDAAAAYASSAAAVAEARTSISEAARSIRVVLAKGLAGRNGKTSTSASKKENDPGGGAPLVRKFQEAKADMAEQDKVIATLRSMLRRGGGENGKTEKEIDNEIDTALFKGVDMNVHGAGGLPAIAPGASRELLMRELRSLKVREDASCACMPPARRANRRRRRRKRRGEKCRCCCFSLLTVFFPSLHHACMEQTPLPSPAGQGVD